MASPLDIGLLQNFSIIFPFLFVFCITWGLLAKVKFFENQAINATIAVALAMMTLFSDVAMHTINVAAPWFVILIVFGVFLLLGFMMAGAKEGDISGALSSGKFGFVFWWIFALILIIVLGSLSHTMSLKKGGYPPFNEGLEDANANGTVSVSGTARTLQEGTEGQESDFWKTLFHPKVLGMAVLLLISFFAINRLTRMD